jgi:hypothetical protein
MPADAKAAGATLAGLACALSLGIFAAPGMALADCSHVIVVRPVDSSRLPFTPLISSIYGTMSLMGKRLASTRTRFEADSRPQDLPRKRSGYHRDWGDGTLPCSP